MPWKLKGRTESASRKRKKSTMSLKWNYSWQLPTGRACHSDHNRKHLKEPSRAGADISWVLREWTAKSIWKNKIKMQVLTNYSMLKQWKSMEMRQVDKALKNLNQLSNWIKATLKAHLHTLKTNIKNQREMTTREVLKVCPRSVQKETWVSMTLTSKNACQV